MENSILYIQRLQHLLQLEHDHEKEEYRLQTEKMGLQRKINRGLCWHPIALGRSYYNSLNQLVVEIIRRPSSREDVDFETHPPSHTSIQSSATAKPTTPTTPASPPAYPS